jgi:thioredoxin-like negative regulator of GroEL
MKIAPLLAFAAMAAAVSARAAEFRDFDRATFEAARVAGRPTILDVHAWWCPVCASQGRTIKKAAVAPQYDNLLVLRIDYDKQKPEWRSFGVNKQATLIAFKHGREVGRVAFETNHAKIEALLAAAVS